jgi:hypothetical protein
MVPGFLQHLDAGLGADHALRRQLAAIEKELAS